jgi:integrase
MLSFYIRDAMLYLRWSTGGQSYRLSTGRKIQPGYLIDKRTRLLDKKDRYAMQTNSQLVRLLADAELIILSDKSEDAKLRALKVLLGNTDSDTEDIYLDEYLRTYVESLENGRIKTRKGKLAAASSLRTFYAILGRLTDLRKEGYSLPLKASDLTGVDQSKRREIADKTSEYYLAFHEQMIEDDMAVTSQARYMDYLKGVIHQAEKDLLIRVYTDYSMLKEELPVTTLSPEMVKSFLRIEYNDLEEDLRMPYELSFVILITSLRVGDAMKLTFNDFNIIDGKCVIYGLKNRKTGTITASPIPERLYNILKANHERSGNIYSSIDNYQTMRRDAAIGMQKIMRMIPECSTEVSLTRLSPDGKSEIRVTKPLWEMVKPHMLRKTAITTMLHAGVDQHLIKNLSGHSGKSASFERYVGYVESVHNIVISDYQDKLMG